MSEVVVVDMSEVKERPILAKGVYTFTFKNSKAFLVKAKAEGSDSIGLSGVLVPEGHPDDAFPMWLAINKSYSFLDAKKFFKGLGYDIETPGMFKIGGTLSTPEEVKAGTGPQATFSINGSPPKPVGFLKFKGETILETNKDNGWQQPRLNTTLGRVE